VRLKTVLMKIFGCKKTILRGKKIIRTTTIIIIIIIFERSKPDIRDE
jgi:hypothetical protein